MLKWAEILGDNMKDLFEHAPEEAAEVVLSTDGGIRYATKDSVYTDNGLLWLDSSSIWQTLAPRPQQPRKTVEDAVEWADRRWRAGETAICELDGELYFADNNLRMRNVICTREEFEACVATKSNPKWTHYYMENEYCKIVVEEHDKFGMVVVDCEDSEYIPCYPSDIKPTKPTISKAEKEKVAEFVEYLRKKSNYEAAQEFKGFINGHELGD
jgi:hypothetical protein